MICLLNIIIYEDAGMPDEVSAVSIATSITIYVAECGPVIQSGFSATHGSFFAGTQQRICAQREAVIDPAIANPTLQFLLRQ